MLTAPNSPSARAVVSTTPYATPQRIAGSVTRKKVWNGPAPSVAAACSCSVPISRSTGIVSRTTNGSETNMVARIMPGRREDDPDALLGEPVADPAVAAFRRRAAATGPTTTGDTANGRSIAAFRSARPRKRWRTITSAATTPKIVLSGTATATMTNVR